MNYARRSIKEQGSPSKLGRACLRFLACLGLLACVTLCGCSSSRAPRAIGDRGEHHPSPVSDVDAVAREYVELALALGERDPDSLDFTIAPPALAAAAHRDYLTMEQLAAKVERLRAQAAELSPASEDARKRVDVLRLQLAATAARIGMLRHRVLPFDMEAKALFATERLPDTKAVERKQTRAEIARLLAEPSASRKDSSRRAAALAERYAAYNQQFLVPPQRLGTVMEAALAACREQTVKHLRLPAGERVELAFVRREPWSAFSRFKGSGHSVISVNLDFPITVNDALELACHEGYPGHHVFNTLREQALVAQRHLPEAEVQLTFSPQSYVSEAAAAFAPELAFSEEDRLRVEQNVLFPLAGLPAHDVSRYVRLCSLIRRLSSAEPEIAQGYIDGRLEFFRAEQVLADTAVMAHAEAVLLYLNEYRSYMLAYTDGPRRMRALLGTGSSALPEARWQAFLRLSEHMVVQVNTTPILESTVPASRSINSAVGAGS